MLGKMEALITMVHSKLRAADNLEFVQMILAN